MSGTYKVLILPLFMQITHFILSIFKETNFSFLVLGNGSNVPTYMYKHMNDVVLYMHLLQMFSISFGLSMSNYDMEKRPI